MTSATMSVNGTNVAMSSIMGVGEDASMLNSTIVLVLEIYMTILCEKLPRLFAVANK